MHALPTQTTYNQTNYVCPLYHIPLIKVAEARILDVCETLEIQIVWDLVSFSVLASVSCHEHNSCHYHETKSYHSVSPRKHVVIWNWIGGTDDLYRASVARSHSPKVTWLPAPNIPLINNGAYGSINLMVQSIGHADFIETSTESGTHSFLLAGRSMGHHRHLWASKPLKTQCDGTMTGRYWIRGKRCWTTRTVMMTFRVFVP